MNYLHISVIASGHWSRGNPEIHALDCFVANASRNDDYCAEAAE